MTARGPSMGPCGPLKNILNIWITPKCIGGRYAALLKIVY